MKIAVTGHTAGIGKALYREATRAGHFVTGYSRENTGDLNETHVLLDVLNEMVKVFGTDVIVNNAYSGEMQQQLLMTLHRKHHGWMADPKNTVLVLSSLTTVRASNIPKSYVENKRRLEETCVILQDAPDIKCRIVIVRPGFVDTKLVKDLLDKTKHRYLEPGCLARFLLTLIESPVYVKEVNLVGDTL